MVVFSRGIRIAVAVTFLTGCWPQVRGQVAAAAFEVASITLNTSGAKSSLLKTSNGRLDATNVIPLLLIQDAYGVQSFYISGPFWVSSERYDIHATGPISATSADMMPMLQALLADRFNLKVHRETKEGSLYMLSVAKGGLKVPLLKDGSCIPGPPDWSSGPPPANRKPMCGAIIPGGSSTTRTMEAVGTTTKALARTLALILGRSVVDRTGITTPLDALRLEYSLDNNSSSLGGPNDANGTAPPASVAPSIFTALQEQIGLKLESGKGPIEGLVIDHIERPSGN
jgi:uncharacterized protein (TIGR03435 family)